MPVARRDFGLTLGGLLFLCLSGRGSSYYGRVQPQIETWNVTQASPPALDSRATQIHAPDLPSTQVLKWKDITVEQTSRDEVEDHYGKGRTVKLSGQGTKIT